MEDQSPLTVWKIECFFYLIHLPPPSSLPFFGYLGFLIGSVIHITWVECRKRVCCVVRAWVSGGGKGNQSSLTKYTGN